MTERGLAGGLTNYGDAGFSLADTAGIASASKDANASAHHSRRVRA